MQPVNNFYKKKNTPIHVIISSFVKISFHEDDERVPEEKYKNVLYLSLGTLKFLIKSFLIQLYGCYSLLLFV